MSIERSAIERRAYEIWEAEGRPEGRAEDHWWQAETELRDGEDSDQDGIGHSEVESNSSAD